MVFRLVLVRVVGLKRSKFGPQSASRLSAVVVEWFAEKSDEQREYGARYWNKVLSGWLAPFLLEDDHPRNHHRAALVKHPDF